jgi:hypothetical protein
MAAHAVPPPNTPVKNLTLTPDDAAKLTPAAANLTFADLQSLEAAFQNQQDRLNKMQVQPDLGCCCCCCSVVATVSQRPHIV